MPPMPPGREMPLTDGVAAELPKLTVLPPLPPRLFSALAMSSAIAYLIGMTSEMYSAGTDTSI